MQTKLFSVLAFTAIFQIASCEAQDSRPKEKKEPTTKSSADKNLLPVETTKPVGGGCDGCEIMYVGMPVQIDATDTSAGWSEKGQPLMLTGYVYQRDGRTPSAGVVLYYWQTDHEGYYSARPDLNEKAKRHGHIRGWVKTGADGKYTIYTIRPSAYPGENIPAHIHIAVKEPHINNEYYIDELVFDDDRLLTTKNRRSLENRGGSGILRTFRTGNLELAEHNIVLGLNIPGYPVRSSAENPSTGTIKANPSSGLQR